jgi:hypothetical protein
MKALARRYHGEMIAERGMDLEAHVLEAIHDLKEAGRPLVVKELRAGFRTAMATTMSGR